MRYWYSGRALALQAREAGSTPAYRSNVATTVTVAIYAGVVEWQTPETIGAQWLLLGQHQCRPPLKSRAL